MQQLLIQYPLIQHRVDAPLNFCGGCIQIRPSSAGGRGMGSPIRNWIGTRRGQFRPEPRALWLLTMATGKSGALVRAASRAAPGRGWFTRPSGWRVPSRKTPVAQPSSSRAVAPDRFSVAGATSHWVSAAGTDHRSKHRYCKEFCLRHEGHGTAEGMAQQGGSKWDP